MTKYNLLMNAQILQSVTYRSSSHRYLNDQTNTAKSITPPKILSPYADFGWTHLQHARILVAFLTRTLL